MSRFTAASLSVGLAAAILAGCGATVASRIDDGVLTTRVRTALLYDGELAERRLAVVTVAGVVTLSGEVGSADEAERAARLARAVVGVRDVRTRLTVRPGGAGLTPAV